MGQEEMRLADSVFHRVVQIVQESMLLGVDCADLLRQIRLVADPTDPTSLVLSPEYQRSVRQMHEKMQQQAEELQAARTRSKLVTGDSN